MLYKKKKNKLNLRKLANQPYIGVIETTMMYHSMDDPHDRLISVSQIYIRVNSNEPMHV